MSFEDIFETNSNDYEFYEIEDEHDNEWNNENDCKPLSFSSYADGTYLKLRDCGIKQAAFLKVYNQKKVNESFEVYQKIVKLYDLVNWTNLKTQFITSTLDVQKCGLSENDIKAVMKALNGNNHVISLNLSENVLNKPACGYVAELISKNKIIKHLKLQRCQIDSEGASKLSETLEIASLETLNMSYNNLGNKGLHFILDALQANKYLLELDLSHNNLMKGCGLDISTFIGINDKLRLINLSNNYIDNKIDLSNIVRSINYLNETLKTFILQWNGISSKECANVFRLLFMKSEYLKVLDISWNNLKNIGSIFGKGMKKSISVEHLDISNNPLAPEDIMEMLNAIIEPSSLKILSLTHVLVDEKIEKAISNLQNSNPELQIKVGLYTNIRRRTTDLQSLYLRRIHYLGVMKPKKKSKKVDIGHTLLRLKQDGKLIPMKMSNFLLLLEGLKINGTEDLLSLLARQFRNSEKKVDVELMLDKYMELYPNTELRINN
ncbi:leucine-rich repeat-containing protein 74B-like [Daktulosphaira vitifoliae]|uniref:leucine-rich repeat-containing protein 74B-like n=1 Tax=Daktulosphaira vitifoliae TaxID=58002 RepID=UPI0021AAABE7|nr:leucine-rich repeat-containing protein 74B-like [Daktulosphaira vitifoliae]